MEKNVFLYLFFAHLIWKSSTTYLGLNEFRLDLLDYMHDGHDIVMDWEPLEDAALPLMGLDLDKVWEHLVTTIGKFEVMEGVTMEEQIAIDGEKLKKIKLIESLEKKLKVEKQPRKKYELYQQLMGLKGSLT